MNHDNTFNCMTFFPAMNGNPLSLTMCGKHIPQDFLNVIPKIKVLFKDFSQGNYNRLPHRIQTHL